MALILCIETGTDICSVGIVNNGELISLRESDSGRDHAQKVGVFVDELLKENNIQPEELDAVAVGEGPGSYTGLRIGVSFAKGLCYGLNKPLIAISSLEALTAVAIEDYNAGIIDIEDWNKVKLCPMIDARRMEVYAQVFDSNGTPINAVAAEIVTDQSFAEYRDSDSSLVIFGSGAAKCADILGAKLIDITPSVRGMAAIAEKKFSSSDFVDVAYYYNGQFKAKLQAGNYTVNLGIENEIYYYNKQKAVLTEKVANLTIRLASEIDPKKFETNWMINDNKMYMLKEGVTHVQLGAEKAYAFSGEDYVDCLFAFEPNRTGVYNISVDYPGMEIRAYGQWIGNITDKASNYENGALRFEIKDQSQVGNVYLIFGIEVKEDITDACVTIERVGEPGFSFEDLPVSDAWSNGYVPTKQSAMNGTPTYIDIKESTDTYNIFYNAEMDVYQINLNGNIKTLYMNMGTVTLQNISLNIVVNGGLYGGGTSLRRYFKDEDGNIKYKEDYTSLICQYIDCADKNMGLYPVTGDLAYIVQNAKPGWWDASSPDYILMDCNPELGWLFACCYM